MGFGRKSSFQVTTYLPKCNPNKKDLDAFVSYRNFMLLALAD